MNTRSRVWLNRFRSRRNRGGFQVVAHLGQKPRWPGKNAAGPGPQSPAPPPSAPSRSLADPSPGRTGAAGPGRKRPVPGRTRTCGPGPVFPASPAAPGAPTGAQRPGPAPIAWRCGPPGPRSRTASTTRSFSLKPARLRSRPSSSPEASSRSRRPRLPMICCLTLPPFPVGADNLQIFVRGSFNDTTFNPDEHANIMAINLEDCQDIIRPKRQIVGHYSLQFIRKRG
jgi:hypothetical protein